LEEHGHIRAFQKSFPRKHTSWLASLPWASQHPARPPPAQSAPLEYKKSLAAVLEASRVQQQLFTAPPYPLPDALKQWYQELAAGFARLNATITNGMCPAVPAPGGDPLLFPGAMPPAASIATLQLATSPKAYSRMVDLPSDGENNCGFHMLLRMFAAAKKQNYNPTAADAAVQVVEMRSDCSALVASSDAPAFDDTGEAGVEIRALS
jgi:hypothetical protein